MTRRDHGRRGIGQACGHNVIAAMGVGAAIGFRTHRDMLRPRAANAVGIPQMPRSTTKPAVALAPIPHAGPMTCGVSGSGSMKLRPSASALRR